jgi:hypothetical protein
MDSKREKIDNSFEMDGMATEFYRDMCMYMIHTWIKGIAKWRCGLPGMCLTTGSNAAVRDEQKYDHRKISTEFDPM